MNSVVPYIAVDYKFHWKGHRAADITFVDVDIAMLKFSKVSRYILPWVNQTLGRENTCAVFFKRIWDVSDHVAHTHGTLSIEAYCLIGLGNHNDMWRLRRHVGRAHDWHRKTPNGRIQVGPNPASLLEKFTFPVSGSPRFSRRPIRRAPSRRTSPPPLPEAG